MRSFVIVVTIGILIFSVAFSDAARKSKKQLEIDKKMQRMRNRRRITNVVKAKQPKKGTPKRVILKVSREIKARIVEAAQVLWPHDYEMQQYTIRNQIQAYRNVVSNTSAKGVPSSVFERIKNKAQALWPHDYEMQEYTIRNQIQAYRNVVSNTSAKGVPSSVFERIKNKAQALWPHDYEMQEYTIKNQVTSYLGY